MRATSMALQAHTKGKRVMTTKLPRERLKALRERSGLSGSELARSLGYANPSGYFRFEQEKMQGTRPLPYEVVKRLIPILRGRGEPPITAEELLLLTDAKDIPKPIQQAFVSVVDSSGGGLLAVKYRIEKGVFVRVSSTRSYGASRLGVSALYPPDVQFAAVVSGDDSGLPSGTQLHCVEPDAIPTGSIKGRRVLVGIPETEGIVEVTVGKMGTDGNPFSLDGMPLEGSILGVVIGAFVPE